MPTAPPICSSRRRRSGPRFASISATASGCTSATSSKARCRELKGKTVVVDPERAVAAIFEALDKAGAKILPLRDPTILPKAIKNPAEIAGQKAAQTRDGAAIARFLHWIDEEAPKGEVDELKASDHLEALRRENAELRDLSFDSISGAGPNGAIVHYRSSEKTNRKLEQGTLYLIDSRRPICRRHHRHHPHRRRSASRPTRCAIASPECSRAISRSPPPYSPRARAGASSTASPAARCGKPGSITPTAPATASAASSRSTRGRSGFRRSEARRAAATSRLQPGMIISNEPGYYKTGEYGIRIENLVLVVPREIEGAEKEMLGFETLTFAPIDRRLIDVRDARCRGADLAQLLPRARAGEDRADAERGGPRLAAAGLRADRRVTVIPAKAGTRLSSNAEERGRQVPDQVRDDEQGL